MTHPTALTISQKVGKGLSKRQKQFNTNVEKISQLKQQLLDDEIFIRTLILRIQSEIIPLQNQINQKIVELIRIFDRHHDDAFFKKKEKEKLRGFILEHVTDLIHKGFNELKAIHDKYSNETFDEIDARAKSVAASVNKTTMESMFGIDFDENADVSNPQKMQEYIAQKMAEKQTEAQANEVNQEKSDKQLKREEKLKVETKNISKATRSIYTDLVKAFHPDREQDETERNRKTEIMKKVTQAYEKDDLFELLKLKIELQSSDVESLTTIDEQLKYYNKILKEQINNLQEQLWQLRTSASNTITGIDLFQQFGGDEATQNKKFAYEVARIKKNKKLIEKDTIVLRVKENMRQWLMYYEVKEDFEGMMI
jgi:hypothetical protein